MPVTPSLRLQGIDAMVTTLRGITPGNGYTFDLSATGAVTKEIQTIDARKAVGLRATVRVRDGAETYTWQTQLRYYSAEFMVALELVMTDVDGTEMVDQLNVFLQDVHRRVNAVRDLGLQGAVDVLVTAIDEPEYDLTNAAAAVLVRVQLRYDFQAGTSL